LLAGSDKAFGGAHWKYVSMAQIELPAEYGGNTG